MNNLDDHPPRPAGRETPAITRSHKGDEGRQAAAHPRDSPSSTPASPLQAARLARGWTQRDVCQRMRKVCPGHHGRKCKLQPSKLSCYETGAARPTLQHVEVFCAVFGMSPEDLGLIRWRGATERDKLDSAYRARVREEVRAELLEAILTLLGDAHRHNGQGPSPADG